ncbi:50S ribosomal protein L3 [Candidatus Woesearchaeota archaeon]|jgi:large subunit ribosomal protein L3|nr:50S ribosomal protein L3 [Candidatus Woesearchaeota archaeon]
MGKAHASRRGSMQFWPRKRSRHNLARIRSWPSNNVAKPLGFIGYKAGMTHLMAEDNHPKSITKGQEISLPTTIIDCPPMFVCGVSFYKKSILGLQKSSQIFAEKLNKDLSRKIQLPKKTINKINDITEFADLRLLVQSQPKLTTTGDKKPRLLEIALGGSKEDKLAYAKEKLGQEIKIEEVLNEGDALDVHGITKGKGFQGTVKRFGVMVRSHKAEKTKRGIGNLGAWTPKRVDYRVPQPGKMGFHLRTEYNKQILKISSNPEEVNSKRGLHKYGLIKSSFLLIKGSVPGPRKRALVLIPTIRPNKKTHPEAPAISYIAK